MHTASERCFPQLIETAKKASKWRSLISASCTGPEHHGTAFKVTQLFSLWQLVPTALCKNLLLPAVLSSMAGLHAAAQMTFPASSSTKPRLQAWQG